MERVRLVGIARGAAQVLVQRTVVADDQGAFGRIDVLDPFDLELDDGRVLRVEPTKEARLEPLQETKVEWGTIEDDPSFAPLRAKGPAPHVEVVVKRRAVVVGDRVALVGDEKDFVFEGEDAAGMRTAPTKKLCAVTAELLAIGPDAERILDDALEGAAPSAKKKSDATTEERPAKAKPLRAFVTPARVLFWLGVACFGVVSQMRTSPSKLDLVAIAFSLVAMSAAVGYRAALPRFVQDAKAVDDTTRTFTALAIATLLGIVAFMGFALISDVSYANDTPPSNASPAIVGVLASWMLALAVMLHFFTRKTAALVAVLARAAPFAEDFRDYEWGGAFGVVRDPTPVNVEGELHAVVQMVDVRVQSGSDPDIVVEKVVNEGTFLVDTAHAGKFELNPKDATWASSVRQLVHADDAGRKWTYAVPLGGSIFVAGRAARPTKGEKNKKKRDAARFTKGKSGSLLFYATASHKDARREIRRLAERRFVAFAMILACAGALVAWAAIASPHLPPFHIQSSGD